LIYTVTRNREICKTIKNRCKIVF